MMPSQQPTDFIDQATRVLNFVDALKRREGGQQPDSPSQYSTAQFQSQSPQQIAQQQQRLSQLGRQQPANNLEQNLQLLSQAFVESQQQLDMATQVINSLVPFMQATVYLNQDIAYLEQMVDILYNYAQVTSQAVPFVEMANIWAQDAIAHEQVLDNVCNLMADPEFLTYWAFHVWNQHLNANSAQAINLISEQYLSLADSYERMAGMPQQQQMARPNPGIVMGSPEMNRPVSIPAPPVPGGGSGGDPMQALRDRISLLKNATPDLGMQLQRQHVINRQYQGVM